MDQALRGILSQMAGRSENLRPRDSPHHPDTSETIKISALALLKMLKHARDGVPLEVMGLMLGDFVDDYTITVTDVFAMPQSGTSISVESIDPAYQAKMLEMLHSTGRSEMVVGWYHSHPGFGCWLSGQDQSTQQSFEALHKRAVALVVDPIQSVKGKVVLEAFRLVPTTQILQTGFNAIRQQTSCIGHHQTTATAAAIIHGLGRKYYSLICEYSMSAREQLMLSKLNSKSWMDGFKLDQPNKFEGNVAEALDGMVKYTNHFYKEIKRESTRKPLLVDKPRGRGRGSGRRDEAAAKYGVLDAKTHLVDMANHSIRDHVAQTLTTAVACTTMRHTQQTRRKKGEEEEEEEARAAKVVEEASIKYCSSA